MKIALLDDTGDVSNISNNGKVSQYLARLNNGPLDHECSIAFTPLTCIILSHGTPGLANHYNTPACDGDNYRGHCQYYALSA